MFNTGSKANIRIPAGHGKLGKVMECDWSQKVGKENGQIFD